MQQYFSKSKKDDYITLLDEDYNHIKNVMRYKTDDQILVVYENKRYLCSLLSDLKTVKIIREEGEYKNGSVIHAYIPLLEESKMSFVIEKAVEMNVSAFTVVVFKHSKYHLTSKDSLKKLERWKKIIKSACMQSHRMSIPQIDIVYDVSEIKTSGNINLLCSLDKENVKHISKVLTNDNVFDTINVTYGPEGGISKEEEETLVSNGWTRISLGENVLRTETVIICILSIIMYLKR